MDDDPLPDLSDMDLRALLQLGDDVLAGAVRRIERELAKPGGAVAGWQSVIIRPGDIPADA